MKLNRFWVAGGIVLLAVGFVGWKSSRPPKVDGLIIRLKSVTSTLAVSGVLEASNKTTISSQINGGLVKEVRADIGKVVQAGEVLIVLESSEPQAQLLAAEALIQQSDSQVQLQEVIASTSSRTVALAREGLNSVSELRNSVATASSNQRVGITKVEQARANLDITRNGSRLEQVRIAKAQLSRARALMELNRKEAERSAYLFREGAISERENQVAQATLETSRQDVEVAKEQVLSDSTPRSEDVRFAESQLSEAQAGLIGATEVLKLAQNSLEDRLTSRQQLVQAEGELNAAIANKRVSATTKLNGQAQRQVALSSIAKTLIRSPITGTVAQRLIEPGQTVSVGTPLLILDGSKQLRVKLNIEEASIALIKVGAKATVGFDAFGTMQLPAIVSEIGTSANFQLGTVEVRLRLLGSDARLKPQLTADANILIASYPNVATVPQSALVSKGEKASVYVVERGKVKERTVAWSKGNEGNVIIRSGLSAGDVILVNPRGIKPGNSVEVVLPKPVTGDSSP